MSVLAVTLATDDSPALQDWLTTAKRCGYETKVLGLGEKWQGFRWRLSRYTAVADQLAANSLVVFADAYDVLFNAPTTKAIEVFSSYGKPILCGLETACLNNCVGPVIQTKDELRNMNAGVIMGEAGALSALFHKALDTKIEDDQVALGTVCRLDPNVAFDTKRALVANLEPFALSELRWSDQDKTILVGKPQSFDTKKAVLASLLPLRTLDWNPFQRVLVDGVQPCLLHFPSTISDGLLRERFLRRHLVGPNRSPSWSQIGKTYSNKWIKQGAIKVVVWFLLAAAIVTLFWWRSRK